MRSHSRRLAREDIVPGALYSNSDVHVYVRLILSSVDIHSFKTIDTRTILEKSVFVVDMPFLHAEYVP